MDVGTLGDLVYEKLPDIMGGYSTSDLVAQVSTTDGLKEVALAALIVGGAYKSRTKFAGKVREFNQTRPGRILYQYGLDRNPDLDELEAYLNRTLKTVLKKNSGRQPRGGQKYRVLWNKLDAEDSLSDFSKEECEDLKKLLVIQEISDCLGGWCYLSCKDVGGGYQLEAIPLSYNIEKAIVAKGEEGSNIHTRLSELTYSTEDVDERKRLMEASTKVMSDIRILKKQYARAQKEETPRLDQVKTILDETSGISLNIVPLERPYSDFLHGEAKRCEGLLEVEDIESGLEEMRSEQGPDTVIESSEEVPA